MRIVNILSTENIDKTFVRQPIEFYLAHIILENPELFKKVVANNAYIIVDCSACELGHGLTLNETLKAAKLVNADEVILPDIVRNNASYRLSIEALNMIVENKLFDKNIAFVIQGRTLEDAFAVVDSLCQAVHLNKISTIMIPKWFNTSEREALTCYIQRRLPKKVIHWLGLGNDIANCIDTARRLNIRSLDTGYFISIAQKGLSKILRPVRDRRHKINLRQNNLTYSMVNIVIEAVNNYDFLYQNALTLCPSIEYIKDVQFGKKIVRFMFLITMSIAVLMLYFLKL